MRELSPHQLRWAILRAAEEEGRDPVKAADESRRAETAKQALELVVWYDKHVTR